MGKKWESNPLAGIETSTGGGDTALRERSEKVESEAKAKRESISSLFYEYEQPDIEPFIAWNPYL